MDVLSWCWLNPHSRQLPDEIQHELGQDWNDVSDKNHLKYNKPIDNSLLMRNCKLKRNNSKSEWVFYCLRRFLDAFYSGVVTALKNLIKNIAIAICLHFIAFQTIWTEVPRQFEEEPNPSFTFFFFCLSKTRFSVAR